VKPRRRCGAKNRKIDPWVIAIPAFLSVIKQKDNVHAITANAVGLYVFWKFNKTIWSKHRLVDDRAYVFPYSASRPWIFQGAIDGVRKVTAGVPQRVHGSKSDFLFIDWIKCNFGQINSATKFLCVKTFSRKVVVYYLTIHR